MTKTLSIRIPLQLERDLRSASRNEHVAVSDLVRQSIRQFIAVKRFRKLRDIVLPFAEAQGLLTDEEVFKAVE